MENEKKLYRSKTNRIICGVCGGLGKYFNIDPIIFRIIFLALVFGGGLGVFIYLVMAFLIPKEPDLNISGQTEPPFKEKVENLSSELKEFSDSPKSKNFIGIGIIILGLFLLLNQFLPWQIFSWSILWPIIIIGLGVLVLKRGRSGEKCCAGKENNQKKEESKTPEFNSQKIEPLVKEIHHHHEYKRGGGIFRLFFGLIFLLVGLGFLAQNLGFVPGFNFEFSVLFNFWPVLIILAGMSLLSRGTWLGSLISVFITLAIILCIVFFFVFPGKIGQVEVSDFDIAKAENITKANVFLETGASSINIMSGTKQLVSGKLESNIAELVQSDSVENGEQSVKIETKGDIRNLKSKIVNKLGLRFADDIPLSLNLKFGASSFTLDASNLIVENLRMETGASSIDLALGDKAALSRVSIEAGASSITITIPQTVCAKIEMEGALNGKNFVDFKQTGETTYQTDNYDSAEKKIEVKISAGVSSVSVLRK